jgi:manganese-dependent ADP-ribose/CDP-alcohol diphosphatase
MNIKFEIRMKNSEFRSNRFRCASSRNSFHADLNLIHQHSEFSNRISTVLLLALLSMISSISLAQSPTLKIGLMADIQYCDCETAGTRHYRLSLEKTEEAVNVLLKEKVDFTVVLGDMIDRDLNSFGPVYEKLEPLQPNVVMVPGNHDFAIGEGKEADRTRRAFMRRSPEVRIHENVRMLFLNGMRNSIMGWPEGSREHARGLAIYTALKVSGAPNAQEWNGGLGERQLNWIRKQLKQANRRNQSLILFCHLPALPGDPHSLWDTPLLLEILEESNRQVLYFCGHKHSGGDDQAGNCRIINLKGMVEGTGNAFSVLEIDRDRWVLKGYGGQQGIEGGL